MADLPEWMFAYDITPADSLLAKWTFAAIGKMAEKTREEILDMVIILDGKFPGLGFDSVEKELRELWENR